MIDFLVGVDGGGTGCRAAVADLSGRVLGSAAAGAANILTDRDGAIANIRASIDAALKEAGLGADALARSGVVLGLAGANVGDGAAFVVRALPVSAAAVESDALIALEGALGSGDGAVAILGTGSVFMTRRGAEVRSFGGWGFPIGDFGSGARIGQSVLAECLLVYDGIRAGSPLTARILRSFGDEPGPMVEFARTATPRDFGRYAPDVFAAAGEDDSVGLRLVRAAAGIVDEGLDRVVAEGIERIALLGGLAPLYADWLAERHRRRLVQPAANALSGAVALARRRYAPDNGAPSC